MPDNRDNRPARSTVNLTNVGDGPRSFFDADGGSRILRPGESFEGEVLDADLKDLSGDLKRDASDKETAEAGKPTPPPSPPPGGDTTGAGYAAGGENAARIQESAEALAAGNTRDQLLQIAKDEGVSIESDANKPAIAIAIARKRAGIAPEANS